MIIKDIFPEPEIEKVQSTLDSATTSSNEEVIVIFILL